MKEIKREVTTEQVVYEISKEELDSIKREERNKVANHHVLLGQRCQQSE